MTLFTKKAGETRMFRLDFGRSISGDEVVDSAAVVEVGTSVLTIAAEAVTDEERPIAGRAVPKEHAIQFTIAGGVAGATYILRATATTDEGQILVRKFRLRVM